VKNLKAKAKAEKVCKLFAKIDKSKHKLQQVKTGKYIVPK